MGKKCNHGKTCLFRHDIDRIRDLIQLDAAVVEKDHSTTQDTLTSHPAAYADSSAILIGSSRHADSSDIETNLIAHQESASNFIWRQKLGPEEPKPKGMDNQKSVSRNEA